MRWMRWRLSILHYYNFGGEREEIVIDSDAGNIIFGHVDAANKKTNKPQATLDEALSFIDRKLAENTYKNKYVTAVLTGDYVEYKIIESRLEWSPGSCYDIRVVTTEEQIIYEANHPEDDHRPIKNTNIIGFSLSDLDINSVRPGIDEFHYQSDWKTKAEIPNVDFMTIGKRKAIKVNRYGKVSPDYYHSLLFDDMSIAERVAKALVHAIKLCQPSDAEPF